LPDRSDIHIEVLRVEYEKLRDQRLGEPSDTNQKRVEAAQQCERGRFTANLTASAEGELSNPIIGEASTLSIQFNADMRLTKVANRWVAGDKQ
jgi:hypothetical protein